MLVGPGIADESVLAELLTALVTVDAAPSIVVDARALAVVTPELLAGCRERLVLTPNSKEAAGMLHAGVDHVQADPAGSLAPWSTGSAAR